MTLDFKLNSDLEIIQNWLHSNKLTLNVKKTKYAIISSRYKLNKLNHDFIVSVDNWEIERVTSYKYLGVEIGETLSWRNHTYSLCKKDSAGKGAIKRVRHLVPSQTLHQMYDALVEPYLEYCCEVWGCMGLCQCDRLQKLQNRAARVITSCEGYSIRSANILQDLGWETLDSHNLRGSSNNIFIPRPRTEAGKPS